MAQKSSITRVGTYEPFELQVSRGQISYHHAVTIFGFNPDIDQAEETVWPNGGLTPHPATAISMEVSSTSAADNASSTGAHTLLVEGLDTNYEPISETVSLAGQTAVQTTLLYRRINMLTVLTAGTGLANAGTLYIGTGVETAGVPAIIYGVVAPGYNNSTTAHYTVPAGYTAYLTAGLISCGQAGGSNAITGRLLMTNTDDIRHTVAVTTLNNGAAPYPFPYPVPVPEKTDIEATAVGASNNNAVSAMFNMVLIQNADR